MESLKANSKLLQFAFAIYILNNINMQGYCVKCKAKKEMAEEKEVTMKGKGGVKRKAVTGKCPKCGTKMFRILGKA